MQRFRTLLLLGVIFGFLTFGPGVPAIVQAAQTTCPVLGGKIDKKIFVDYKGERIYFCCKGCVDQFKKNPEKYLEKMKSEGETLEKAPQKY